MQVKKDDIQNRILTVSERLFIKNGYENTSLKMIADKSYISKSNIYRYYRSKDEIYETLVGDARQGIRDTMKIFFTPAFIGRYDSEKCEEIAGIIAKLMSEHHTGMLIMLRSSGMEDRRLVESAITSKFLEACPIDDDEIKELISKLLIVGLTDILVNHTEEEEIRGRLRYLLYYHYLGLYGLKEDMGV